MLILIAIPGPGVFTVVARSLSSGRPEIFTIVAIAIGHLIFLMLAVFGLSYLANVLGEFFILIKICGGVYLVWLGLKIWLTESQRNFFKNKYKKHSNLENFISGLLIALSNPKAILFYCGVLPTFIDIGILKPLDIVIISGIVMASVFLVLGIYAYSASIARGLLTNEIAVNRLNKTAGGLMITSGVIIAIKS